MSDDSQQELSFDDFRQENGSPYWWGSDIMAMLGMTDANEFNKIVNKRAIKAFIAADMDWSADFRSYDRDGITDWKLSRSACYMIVMNANPELPQVAKAQLFFAKMTENFLELQAPDAIGRIITRHELSEAHKSLNSVAIKAGVENFAHFVNAGYLGLYNMYNYQLAKKRGIDKGDLLDHMGRAELAANLFRTTLTEEKIRNESITGQGPLEKAHKDTGIAVRQIVQEQTGRSPEDLPVQKKLPEVKRKLKAANKQLKATDKKKKKNE